VSSNAEVTERENEVRHLSQFAEYLILKRTPKAAPKGERQEGAHHRTAQCAVRFPYVAEYSEITGNFAVVAQAMVAGRKLLLRFLHLRHPWRSEENCPCVFCTCAIHGGRQKRLLLRFLRISVIVTARFGRS
jgi:hypothetical protein